MAVTSGSTLLKLHSARSLYYRSIQVGVCRHATHPWSLCAHQSLRNAYQLRAQCLRCFLCLKTKHFRIPLEITSAT